MQCPLHLRRSSRLQLHTRLPLLLLERENVPIPRSFLHCLGILARPRALECRSEAPAAQGAFPVVVLDRLQGYLKIRLNGIKFFGFKSLKYLRAINLGVEVLIEFNERQFDFGVVLKLKVEA